MIPCGAALRQRAGFGAAQRGFEPLRFVPPGKAVVLGRVSAKTPQLEPADQIAARIEAAALWAVSSERSSG
jgi:methionine synthase II (cobalamin-independent)